VRCVSFARPWWCSTAASPHEPSNLAPMGSRQRQRRPMTGPTKTRDPERNVARLLSCHLTSLLMEPGVRSLAAKKVSVVGNEVPASSVAAVSLGPQAPFVGYKDVCFPGTCDQRRSIRGVSFCS